MAKLLVVDHDSSFARELVASLARSGHECSVATSASDALTRGKTTPVDLIVIAMSLTDMAGTELCRELRASEPTRTLPIIMLSEQDDEIDRVVGLEVGADDVVARSFSLRELGLRVRALLRRRTRPRMAAVARRTSAFVLDSASQRALVDGKGIALTALEFRLLQFLLDHGDRVQTREALLAEVWGGVPMSGRTVDACVKRLRHKLGRAGQHIQTVRGVGYRFRDGDTQSESSDQPGM